MATDSGKLELGSEAAKAALNAVTNETYKDVKSAFFGLCRDWVNIEQNYKNMVEEAEKLYALRRDVLDDLNAEPEKSASTVCQLWIDKVDKLEEEVNDLKSKYSTKGGSNIHLLLSQHMSEKYHELNSCRTEGNSMKPTSKEQPRRVIELQAPKIEDKHSLNKFFNEIATYLKDENVRRVGLRGMVGVGKTAIMKNLNNSEAISQGFDIVIFATLPDDKNFEVAKRNLQREIAERLKLNVEGSTGTKTISSRISDMLKPKKYLLLLDNVWDEIDLVDMGICNNEKGSKVILASRRRDLCKLMDVDEIVTMVPLSEADAMLLFREKLGKRINHPDFEKLAKLVIRQCSNLPLLVDKVAGYFKRKNNNLWWPGLRSLQKWPDVKFPGMDDVLQLLRFCYEELEEDDRKCCFLYSALHTEGFDIYTNYLVECCTNNLFVSNIDRGRIVVDDLIDASLLEEGEKKKYVKMNRVVRKMALMISSQRKDLKFLAKAGEELHDPPSDEEWKDAKCISLMDNRLCSLPEKPICTNLIALLLQRNATLNLIPDQFFELMGSLQVLDLHGIRVAKLPSSLSSLRCLKALYLNSCSQLTELPTSISELEQLEVLDTRDTKISNLPDQIGLLPKLRRLRVSFLKIDGHSTTVPINCNIISKLLMLEELIIQVDSDNSWWQDAGENITEEVTMLERLTYLSFFFPNVACLDIFVTKSLSWKKPDFTFQFSVNNHGTSRVKGLEFMDYDICRCLKYADGESNDHAISESLVKTRVFELIGHRGPVRLSDFGIENVKELQSCVIEGCQQMTNIIDARGIGEGVLHYLKEIYIIDVPKLESFWEGPVPDGSLAQLNVLVFSRCPKLKKIFSSGMIQRLLELQRIEVAECHEIEEIIMKSENSELELITLPKLTTFILRDLPKLRTIWKEKSLNCPLLNYGIFCHNLPSDPFI